jgi:spore coat polysaccharide biosynthesis protein SpsF (cytidylyltransferase family)
VKKNPKFALIITVRMGASRLPGKSLMDIHGHPLIWHVIERVKHAKEVEAIMLATTREKVDDPLADFFKSIDVQVYRGDLNDVLDRYYQAAKIARADVVIRVTGDCPLVDPSIIDEAVKLFKSGNYDYVSNCQEPWMDGFDVEVFSFNALETAWKEATMTSEREHVTPYIRNTTKFKKYFLENDPWFEGQQCSVDRIEDLEFVRAVYAELFKQKKDHRFSYEDVKEVLTKNPKIREINKNSIVNEGYKKSLKEDKKIK